MTADGDESPPASSQLIAAAPQQLQVQQRKCPQRPENSAVKNCGTTAAPVGHGQGGGERPAFPRQQGRGTTAASPAHGRDGRPPRASPRPRTAAPLQRGHRHRLRRSRRGHLRGHEPRHRNSNINDVASVSPVRGISAAKGCGTTTARPPRSRPPAPPAASPQRRTTAPQKGCRRARVARRDRGASWPVMNCGTTAHRAGPGRGVNTGMSQRARAAAPHASKDAGTARSRTGAAAVRSSAPGAASSPELYLRPTGPGQEGVHPQRRPGVPAP